MKGYCLALAALVAMAFAGAAFAGETTRPVKAMSDSELDKVTAGDIPLSSTAIVLENGSSPFERIYAPNQVLDSNNKLAQPFKEQPLGPFPAPQP